MRLSNFESVGSSPLRACQWSDQELGAYMGMGAGEGVDQNTAWSRAACVDIRCAGAIVNIFIAKSIIGLTSSSSFGNLQHPVTI